MPKTNQETRQVAADESPIIPDSDPIVYRYNENAAVGERLLIVPLADIRQSLWDELPKWARASIEKSHLYMKVEGR